MAGQRTTFGKLQRERAKKAKAAAKRERRQGRDPEGELTPTDTEGLAVDTVEPPRSELSSADVLERLETVHQQFDAGMISYEQFAESKDELLSRLQID